MATSTYYEIIPLTHAGHELEAVGAENNFSRAVHEALAMREYGDLDGNFSIVQTVRDGDDADHFEVAYVADGDPDRHGYIVLRIVDPQRLSDYPEWQPGGAGKHFEIDGRRQRVVPMMDPGSMPGRNELMATLERLPYYRDTSYRNDASPSRVFSVGGKLYKLFIAPGRLTARDDPEGAQERQYALFAIDRSAGQSLDEAIAEDDVVWDPVVHTDNPADVARFIETHAHEGDDSAERVALLDLGPKRRSYRPSDEPDFSDAEKRYALIEPYWDDLNVNPSRRRRARRNPDDVAAAKEKYEEFHRHKPKKIWEGPSIIPAKVRLLGKAKAVLYRSDKNDPDTGRAVKNPINYIHDHDAGVKAYAPSRSGDIDVPAFIKDVDAVVVLGKCLGFDFEDDTGVREAQGIKPLPDLCATPCGKALLVIQDRREVLAIIWGGGLGVESRGIVG